MRLALKLAPAIAALLLSACGGGGSGSEAPAPPAEIAPVTLIAGVATPVSYAPEDREPGCVDGAALGAKLNPMTFTKTADGKFLLAERGVCDTRTRIRVIDPARNTIKTLAVGAPTEGLDPLTTFLQPVSIAAAPSGDLYIADSEDYSGISWGGSDSPSSRNFPNRGPGIWKLGTDGNISVVAGVSLPRPNNAPYVDGVGATASFRYIGTMCLGSDGLLYANDNLGLRTISASGTVTTVTPDPDYYGITVMACGLNGSVLTRRWSSDSANDDFYDPIAQKSIAKVSMSASVLRNIADRTGPPPLLYFGPDNPSVLIFEGSSSSSYSGLAVVNLVDGSSETVARFATADRPVDLTATPPVIDGKNPVVGVATGGMNFDILTGRSVIRFTRKP